MKNRYSQGIALLLILEVVLFASVEILGNINGFAPGVDRAVNQFLPIVAANPNGLLIVYLTYIASAVVLIPISLLLPKLFENQSSIVLRLGATFGVISATLRILSASRYLFFVPFLANSYVHGNASAHAAVIFAYQANDAFAGSGLGEYLGDGLFLCLWLGGIAIAILQTRQLPVWTGWIGGAIAALVASVLVAGFLPAGASLIPLSLAATFVWFIILAVVLLRVSPARQSQMALSHQNNI